MRLHDDAFQQLNDATAQWGDIKGFTVVSKESVTELKGLGEGALRLPSDITVTVKIITLAEIENNSDALAKLIKAAESGRLGATKEDGTLLLPKGLADQLSDTQTIRTKNKTTGEEETRVATIESISEENYAIVQAALAILNLSSSKSTAKEEEKVHSTSSRTKVHQAPQEGLQPASAKANVVKQMEAKLNQITTMQDKASQEARDKEKAAQKEQQREARKKEELKRDNLNWDIKQADIKEATEKHVRTHKPPQN